MFFFTAAGKAQPLFQRRTLLEGPTHKLTWPRGELNLPGEGEGSETRFYGGICS